MLEQTSLETYATPAAATSTGARRVARALPSPRKNRLLAALPAADYARLLPVLEPVALPNGWTIHGADERERYLYFPTAGIVSRLYVIENGATAEVSVTGNEGVVGVAAFLGGESTPCQAVVLSAGSAYRLKSDVLKGEFAQGGALMALLLRYALALIAQAGQTAVCNRHHSVQQQLCLWILSCMDRLPSNELVITQEMIARMLGVRREGITQAIGRLQKAGLIRSSRGNIVLLDRSGLEAGACECYAVINREYDRLFSQVNAIGHA